MSATRVDKIDRNAQTYAEIWDLCAEFLKEKRQNHAYYPKAVLIGSLSEQLHWNSAAWRRGDEAARQAYRDYVAWHIERLPIAVECVVLR